MVHGVPNFQEINNIINTMRMRIGMSASSRMVIHTMISIAAFFLESGDNLSTGITYNTRMSKHKMTLKIYNPGMMQRRLERMEDGRRIVGFVGEDDCGYGKQTLVDVGSTHLHGLNYSANKGDAFMGIGAHNTWKELEEVEDRVHEAYMVGDHNWSNFSSGWLSCALYPMKSVTNSKHNNHAQFHSNLEQSIFLLVLHLKSIVCTRNRHCSSSSPSSRSQVAILRLVMALRLFSLGSKTSYGRRSM